MCSGDMRESSMPRGWAETLAWVARRRRSERRDTWPSRRDRVPLYRFGSTQGRRRGCTRGDLRLFPELQDDEHVPPAARVLPSGRLARKLTMRHRQHRKPMLM